MAIRLERVLDVPAKPADVWTFIADPKYRARHVSVVDDFEVDGDGSATWHLSLPIPVIDQTIAIETEDVERRPPEFVKFIGRSRAMRVVGEHELEATETGTRLTNHFTVEGRIPGIERFFRDNLEAEFDNLEAGLRAYLDGES
ncbi:polyketide cyclase [Halorhabdus sp. CBA1104]|uniref:SRPBCC family protein n=1 Tax=unclassified Halorhabdus TaxID=2621901 RepID=UPI0012B3D6CB|nr:MULTISPECIES: SRPBCC family protein [unclassified Halorhabdus]QGN06805.1 polyketide cyclase [Halorhabdus sp. CBA1104]